MTDGKQSSKKTVWEALKNWASPLLISLSTANASMSIIVNLARMITQKIGVASILLGNIGGSIFFNSISLIWNTYSLVNHFKERNIYRKCNAKQTPDAKVRDKRVVQSICLNILCDSLFLIGAIAAIALFGSPIALFVTVPIITLGCVVMVADIANSTHHKVKNFKSYLSQFSKEDQVNLQKEMKKEISESRFYKIVAKILPDIIVLSQLHASTEDKNQKQEVKRLKAELKNTQLRESNNNLISEKGGVDAIPGEDNDNSAYKESGAGAKSKEEKRGHYVSTSLSLGKGAIKEFEEGKEPAAKGRPVF